MKKICHLTSVHPPFDIRVFYKECKTLIQAGYKVVLIVPHDKKEVVEGVRVRGLPKAKNRLDRTTRILWKTYKAAIEECADIYHFHDPELILVGLLLKMHGKRVIYDVHEDYSQVLLSREWIPFWLRRMVTKIVIFEEWMGKKWFDGIVAATPTISRGFPLSKTILVQNFPILNEFGEDSSFPFCERKKVLVYLGVISKQRGVREMVQAMRYLPESLGAQLWLAGKFSPPELENEIKKTPGWEWVRFLGWQPHQDVISLLRKAQVGFMILYPSPNHIESQPNKLFEYMSAGIPVVASNFPLWRDIIEKSGCGVLVDPLDTRAVAEAIRWLLEHPSEAETMGKKGQEAVFEHYNWEGEAKKLLAFYNSILEKR